MDRRIIRTKKLVNESFIVLLGTQKYSDITIQDIIDRANIGRATFYSHYKSKEEILYSIISDIFIHISSHCLDPEKHHDFSNKDGFDHVLHHMLCHFKEDKDTLKAILNSDGHDYFIDNLSIEITHMIDHYLSDSILDTKLPKDLILNQLKTSLIELILWWIKKDCLLDEETITQFYFQINSSLLKI